MKCYCSPQETAGACWMSVGTVLQFRLQCHPALSSALTLFLPTCGFQQPTARLTFLLTAAGSWLPYCLETPTGVMTEPCQCDWQVCTHSRLGHPRSTDDSSQTCEGKRASGFGRLRSKQNRPWLQPMSFGKAVGPVQSLNLVHGVTEMPEGQAKKDEQMNSHGKRGTLDKGDDTREQEEEKKNHKTKRRNIISPSSKMLAMSLALPSYPTPPQERNYICLSSCYH